MNTREGSLVVGRTLAIDDEDYKAFDYLASQGINLAFQLLPDHESRTWSEVKKKYDQMREGK